MKDTLSGDIISEDIGEVFKILCDNYNLDFEEARKECKLYPFRTGFSILEGLIRLCQKLKIDMDIDTPSNTFEVLYVDNNKQEQQPVKEVLPVEETLEQKDPSIDDGNPLPFPIGD